MTANEIYEELKNDILFLTLKPGDMISETELCEKYGISRTPIRDVIKRLVAEDLLEVKPHVGSFVSHIDLNKVSDTIFIRQSLELSILREICATFNMSHALPLQQLLAQQELLVQREATEDITFPFSLSDNAFHAKLYEIAGRPGVWQTVFSLNHHYLRYRNLLVQCHFDPVTMLYAQHCQILEDLIAHDFEALSHHSIEHITSGFQRSTDIMSTYQDYFLPHN